MKKILTAMLSALMIFVFAACGSESGNNSETKNNSEVETEKSVSTNSPTKKTLVVYFSCTGTTKTLAENAAEILQADLYEIKPETPYTEEDLNWRDETTRATVEQRDENSRPALADKNAPISDYQNVVIAFPVWWGAAPRIINTFVEAYDFDGKRIIPICTSEQTDIGSNSEYLKKLAKNKGNWEDGKAFFKNVSKDNIKNYFDSLKL